MTVNAYWRPVRKDTGERLPLCVRDALRECPEYVNNRAFWEGMWYALHGDEKAAVQYVLSWMNKHPGELIEVIES